MASPTGPDKVLVSVVMPASSGACLIAARYSSPAARPASRADGTSVAYPARDGQIPIAMFTARTRMTAPPEVRAMRAATGMARSARVEPSRGTRIRVYMVLLLSTSLSMVGLPQPQCVAMANAPSGVEVVPQYTPSALHDYLA